MTIKSAYSMEPWFSKVTLVIPLKSFTGLSLKCLPALDLPVFRLTFMSASGPHQTFWHAQPTSGSDPGCVKTLFKSKITANLSDFRKLQFAKALISLKRKFWQLDFNHNLIRPLTFSHSLDPKRSSRLWGIADAICQAPVLPMMPVRAMLGL
ncbi:MAG: hypothetical protein ABI705_09685, partial [Aestuariivirga sp.]